MLKNEGFGTEQNFSKIVNDADQTDLEKQKQNIKDIKEAEKQIKKFYQGILENTMDILQKFVMLPKQGQKEVVGRSFQHIAFHLINIE